MNLFVMVFVQFYNVCGELLNNVSETWTSLFPLFMLS